jgi:Spy/CpxP family protein refolding chaperone
MKSTMLKAGAVALALAATSALAQGPGYGQGYGPGAGPMMGGGGYGYGQGGGLAALELSDQQREKVLSLQEEHRRKNWETMGQMRAEMFKLRSLYNSDDGKAIVEQQRKVDDLRRQMLVSRLEMRKQVEQVLSPEQRKPLRSSGPWWLEDLE